MIFDRETFFDSVRTSLFGGAMAQPQVDGMEAILAAWENYLEPLGWDRRWLSYALATTYHETAQEMQPIEEYGKGAGQPYGEVDEETGQTYYGRGFVQLTWRDNYVRADRELEFSGDESLEWHADNALKPDVAARVMFRGMSQAWFRPPNDFEHYFHATTEDAYGAREIINGDKHIVPEWSDGVSIGNLIKGYYTNFLTAVNESVREELASEEKEELASEEKVVEIQITIRITAPGPVTIEVVPNA